MANTTASASGANKYRATPVRNNIGTNTMQMHNVDTSAGRAISPAPSKIALCKSEPKWIWRSIFSMVTVASSTRMPTAKASPPKVMMLNDSPEMYSAMIEQRIDSGMDTAMMQVLRQLPRNTRISVAVKQAAITASRTTPVMAARTKLD